MNPFNTKLGKLFTLSNDQAKKKEKQSVGLKTKSNY